MQSVVCTCVSVFFWGEVLWLSSDSQGLTRVKGPLPQGTTAAAALPAPPTALWPAPGLAAAGCGLISPVPEAVLCVYLKTLSTRTKLRHFVLLHNLQML